MDRRDFLCKTATLAASPLALSMAPSSASAKTPAHWKSVMDAQAVYNQVLKEGLGEPYVAPLHTDITGPNYLWGGLDPIALVERYKQASASDIGGVVYMSYRGGQVGNPEFSADVPIYSGGPSMPALFVSDENRMAFEKQSAEGTFMVTLGMNCLWGIASGPGTQDQGLHSHWAQPGLGAIWIEEFFNPETEKDVTALGAVFYSKGDDWHAASPYGWGMASTALQDLLDSKEPWIRLRPHVPVLMLSV